MTKILFLVSMLLCSFTAISEDHAPTAAQCQADQKWWSSQSNAATSGNGFDTSIKKYSLNELLDRAKEMTVCVSVDYQNHSSYESTAMVILSQTNKRLVRYVQETGQARDYDTWENQQSRLTQ
jgi:hypothetical protein